jgi:hypothetical protein
MAKLQSKAADIKALARKHGRAAIKTLAEIMKQADGPATARVSAAQALLDRGWGKAAQHLAADADELPLFARIERVIVDPKTNQSGDDSRDGEPARLED